MFLRRLYTAAGLFVGSTAFTISAYANLSELEQQREWFKQAELLVSKPNSKEYIDLSRRLITYPLYPYLEFKTLSRYPYLANKQQIDTFLSKYADTPLARPLRKKWLAYLADEEQWPLFEYYYRDVGDVSLQCKRLAFLLGKENTRAAALQEVPSLWVVGKSQPKACDPVFAVWQASGARTPNLVWERLRLAADGGSASLIPYLKTLLPQNQQYLADLWLSVRRAPSYVTKTSAFTGEFPDKEAQIITYGLARLIWKDRDLALKSWPVIEQRTHLSDVQRKHIFTQFSLGLATVNHPSAQRWLESALSLEYHPQVAHWYVANLIRQQKWDKTADFISALPEKQAQALEHKYWRARSLNELGSTQLATQLMEQLATSRHYYGFLASGHLKITPNLADKPLHFSQDEILAVRDTPGAKRAYELLQLQRYTSARREWLALQKTMNSRQQQIAAVIADQWKWHDQAIFAFSRSGYLDDVKRRFPIAYDDHLQRHANKYAIPPAWAFAIVRRESSFMPDANSRAGAKGLMQVMPGTARYLTNQKVRNSTLFDPVSNVKLGTQYMRYLVDKMGDNPVVVTASYNAGWRRVQTWLPESGSQPMDVWVENIPYKETRNYVKAVMAYKQIYAQLLGSDAKLFEHLVDMQISAPL